ncbi:competence protein ComEC, partial [Streptomyces sp. SolWspMP-sol7th]
ASAAVLVLVPLGRMVLRSRWLVCGCVLLLVLAVVRPVPVTRVLGAWPPTGWRFVMCDVGQGDATVLAAGAGTAVVVDAGPDPDRVAGCLDRLGVRRVPLVLLSHFHADHVAGLEGVLRGRAVGAVQTTAFAEPAGQAAAVRRTAAEHGVPVLSAAAGERRKVGGVSWEVVWPPAGGGPVGDDGPNDASLVLSVRTGGVRLLLAGDVEPAVQRELLRRPGGPRTSTCSRCRTTVRRTRRGSGYGGWHPGSPWSRSEPTTATGTRLLVPSTPCALRVRLSNGPISVGTWR